MSVKKMVELYVNYGLTSHTWDMLYSMMCHNLITYDNWLKFYNKCRDWYYNEDKSAIIDGDGKYVYIKDENGIYRDIHMKNVTINI